MMLVLVVSLHCLQSIITRTIIHLEQGDHLLTNLQAFSVSTWRSVAVQDVNITNLVFLVVLRHLNYVSVAHILLLSLGYRDFTIGQNLRRQVVWHNELIDIIVDFFLRDFIEVFS